MFSLGPMVTKGYDHDGNNRVATDHQAWCWNIAGSLRPYLYARKRELTCGLLKVKVLPQRHTFSNRAPLLVLLKHSYQMGTKY